jgi:hypothetical protein
LQRKIQPWEKVSSIPDGNTRFEGVDFSIQDRGTNPCGGGVEYLNRDPASSRRRRKGKSQIWDSKIRSQVPRDSDPRMTALARASSTYERQTSPLVREGAPRKQERNCQTEINILSWAPDGARYQDLLNDWPSVALWLWLWLWMSEIKKRTEKRSKDRSEARHQRVRSHCKRKTVITTSRLVNKQSVRNWRVSSVS